MIEFIPLNISVVKELLAYFSVHSEIFSEPHSFVFYLSLDRIEELHLKLFRSFRQRDILLDISVKDKRIKAACDGLFDVLPLDWISSANNNLSLSVQRLKI